MTWSDFYLICFFLGFFLSLLSLVGSSHIHLPHIDLHIGGSHAHAPHIVPGDAAELAPINFGTIAAFLAWFGGAGYLVARFSSSWFLIGLAIAAVSGLVGAAVVFFFLAKVLIRKGEELDPADYDMVGVLGTISSNIRPSGTGEIMFSQAGGRRAAPARSEDGLAIPKGTEVVVTRYERGIVYVRPWEELTNSSAAPKQIKEELL